MKFIITLLLLLPSLYASLFDFTDDYNEALKQAQKEKKNIYMLVTSDYCRWCRKFEDTTLEDEQLIELMQKKYVLLHITRSRDYIPEKYVAKKVPKHFFLDPKGEVIHSVLGYWNAEDFRSFLGDVDTKLKN